MKCRYEDRDCLDGIDELCTHCGAAQQLQKSSLRVMIHGQNIFGNAGWYFYTGENIAPVDFETRQDALKVIEKLYLSGHKPDNIMLVKIWPFTIDVTVR